MNEEDRRLRVDERGASPERFPQEPVETTPTPIEKEERREELSRTYTASTDSSSRGSIERQANTISRVSTQHESAFDLERHPTALSRIHTARSQHSQTIGSTIRSRISRTQSKKPLPNFGAGKPFPPPLPDREEYVVEFDGPDDPMHGQNWPMKKKVYTGALLGFVCLTAAFGSSIFSVATGTVARQYGVSSEVGILGVSLYVLGFATGE